MRVLLLNPPYAPETFVSGRRRAFLKYVVNIIPPLGLLYIAAALERDGHTVAVHDATLESPPEVAARARAFAPDLIGISATTPSLSSAVAAAAALRTVCPQASYVIGGAHASAMPDALRTLPGFDLQVRGEGEEPMRSLARGDEPAAIPGVVARASDGTLRDGGPPLRLTVLDDLPFPAYHLIAPLRQYIPTAASYRALPLATVMTARGGLLAGAVRA